MLFEHSNKWIPCKIYCCFKVKHISRSNPRRSNFLHLLMLSEWLKIPLWRKELRWDIDLGKDEGPNSQRDGNAMPVYSTVEGTGIVHILRHIRGRTNISSTGWCDVKYFLFLWKAAMCDISAVSRWWMFPSQSLVRSVADGQHANWTFFFQMSQPAQMNWAKRRRDVRGVFGREAC